MHTFCNWFDKRGVDLISLTQLRWRGNVTPFVYKSSNWIGWIFGRLIWHHFVLIKSPPVTWFSSGLLKFDHCVNQSDCPIRRTPNKSPNPLDRLITSGTLLFHVFIIYDKITAWISHISIAAGWSGKTPLNNATTLEIRESVSCFIKMNLS